MALGSPKWNFGSRRRFEHGEDHALVELRGFGCLEQGTAAIYRHTPVAAQPKLQPIENPVLV
jgi:hypothetical protein